MGEERKQKEDNWEDKKMEKTKTDWQTYKLTGKRNWNDNNEACIDIILILC